MGHEAGDVSFTLLLMELDCLFLVWGRPLTVIRQGMMWVVLL